MTFTNQRFLETQVVFVQLFKFHISVPTAPYQPNSKQVEAKSADRTPVSALRSSAHGLHLLGVRLVRCGWHRNVKFEQLYKDNLSLEKPLVRESHILFDVVWFLVSCFRSHISMKESPSDQ